MTRGEIGVTQAETLGRAGRKVLHQNISAVDQSIQHPCRLGMLHIQRDATLAAIEPDKEAGLVMNVAVVMACEITLAGALYLDDIGAKVGHVTTAQRRCHGVFERNNTDAFEGSHDRVCLPGMFAMRKAPRYGGVK